MLFLFELFLVWYLASGRVTRLRGKGSEVSPVRGKVAGEQPGEARSRACGIQEEPLSRRIAAGVERPQRARTDGGEKAPVSRRRIEWRLDELAAPPAVSRDVENEALQAEREQRIR